MNTIRIDEEDRARIVSLVERCKKRITGSLKAGFEYHHLAIARSNRFLRNHDSEKLRMFVLFVDLGESTKMSYELTPNALSKIIRLFSQEMAYVIEAYGGYVLKYVGDAVIGYFPVEKNITTAMSKNTILCGITMVSIMANAINPVLRRDGHANLQIKISADFGTNIIVRYGANKQKSHIDIIGLPINLASKMQTLGRPSQMIIGKQVFARLPSNLKSPFRRLDIGPKLWPYHDFTTKGQYPVYSTTIHPLIGT